MWAVFAPLTNKNILIQTFFFSTTLLYLPSPLKCLSEDSDGTNTPTVLWCTHTLTLTHLPLDPDFNRMQFPYNPYLARLQSSSPFG